MASRFLEVTEETVPEIVWNFIFFFLVIQLQFCAGDNTVPTDLAISTVKRNLEQDVWQFKE
jgi:hypothetical protein